MLKVLFVSVLLIGATASARSRYNHYQPQTYAEVHAPDSAPACPFKSSVSLFANTNPKTANTTRDYNPRGTRGERAD